MIKDNNDKLKNVIRKLPPSKPQSSSLRNFITVLLVILIGGYFIFKSSSLLQSSQKVDLSQILADSKNHKIQSIREEGTTLKATYKNNKGEVYSNIDSSVDVPKLFLDSGVDFSKQDPTFSYEPPIDISFGDIVSLLFIIVAGFGIYLFMKQMKNAGGGLFAFGESKARLFVGKKLNVTFDSVAGIDEAKAELKEVVQFLKNPKKYTSLGARIPRGVLLVGHPGTGKTLLAKAIAGEAGVPFFSVGGPEFEEMVVGAGAARVRDLFAKARKASPCIIFIDEIDSIGRRRGTVMNSGHTEQTLNQILVEMDGFDSTTNVIVIAATNRPDILDPALLRPGRFDRTISLDLPDLDGRKAILEIHAKNKPIDPNVSMEKIAKRTTGFSGADLENMLNEAAILTANENKKLIGEIELEEAATKVTMGPAKKKGTEEKELKTVAYHEAGHALVAKFLPESDPVHRISIIPRGMSAGATTYLPENDSSLRTKTKMITSIIHAMGGYTAEKIVFGDITNGASDDIKKATQVARRMVTSYGMSDVLGPVLYGNEEDFDYNYGIGESGKSYSQKTAFIIDKEVQKILESCQARADEIINKYRHKLDEIVNLLLKQEVIEGAEFDKLFEDIKTV